MDEGRSAMIFDGAVFSVMPADDLDDEKANQIIATIKAHGGEYFPLRDSDNQIEDMLALSHIISTHVDFPQYLSALQHDVAVVKPTWIAASVAKSRPAATRQYSPDPMQFFHNVVLTCAELPEGDKDAIIAGVMALGGQYSASLTKLVTHIVTTDATHEKCQLAEEKGLGCKILLPHWFDDCFRLGKMVNERPYTFPRPEILTETMDRPVRPALSPHLDGAVTSMPQLPPSVSMTNSPPSPCKTRKNLNALMGKKVRLSNDLGLSERLTGTLTTLIEYAGGTLTVDVDECDIYIGTYRDGDEYVSASRASKEVANLAWLYHVINRNKYSNPLSKLLHYPVPRDGIPGFGKMKISISNYTGDSRTYLENLVRHCGAEFTKTMKQDNTHLITAHKHSEKCDAAQTWNINIVNHLWLEESYAKCCVQTLTNTRYQTFPARTNLSEVVGQTAFDMSKVESMFFPRPRKSPQTPNSRMPADKSSSRKTVSQSRALAAATPNERVKTTAPTPITEEVTADGDDDDNSATTKRTRGRPRKSDATPRVHNEEKENQSPRLTTSGRASKARAMESLLHQAEDIAQFQREMKRKGGVTHGGRAAPSDLASPTTTTQRARKKRTSDEAAYDVTGEGDDLSDGEAQQQAVAKAVKKTKLTPSFPPAQLKMMVTGDDRWVGRPKQEDTDQMKLRQLGVQLVQDASDVDVLVAPRILRTRKFVCALASAPVVVGTAYLDAALENGELLEEPSLLKDEEAERRLGLTLSASLERARINNHKLFRGWHIFLTKDITGGFETFKDIVQLNGGEAYQYQGGRLGLTIPKRRLYGQDESPETIEECGPESQHQGGEEEYDFVYLVSGQTASEIKLWKHFREMVSKQELKPRVVSTDWLLHAAMSQEICWRPEWELDKTALGEGQQSTS